MKKIVTISSTLLLLAGSSTTFAMGGDDPLLTTWMINQLEAQDAEQETLGELDAQAWIGKDLNKLWFKAEAEHSEGEFEAAELQSLYSKAIAPFWDMQLGWRRDIKPTPTRDWAVVGVQGLSPYFFETELALFIGDNGRTAMRLDSEYEILLTQRLILTPEIEINVYGNEDAEVGIGSGLSDVKTGLRLRYEIVREFAPYIGLEGWKKYGTTANFAKAIDAETDDLQFVLGFRAWY